MIQIRLFEEKRKSNFELSDFNKMRRYIMRMMNGSMDSFWLYSLVDKVDELKGLEPGNTLYFVPSLYECYSFPDIESMEKWCNRFEAGEILKGVDEETRRKYRPNWHSAMCVKRTAKLYVVRSVDYQY